MQTTLEVIPQKEIEVVKTKVQTMRDQLDAITVTSEDDVKAVAGHIANIKTTRKYLEQERDKYIKPAKEIIASAKETYDPFINSCDEVEYALKNKAQVYLLAEKKKVDEAKGKELNKVASGYQKPETAARKIADMPDAQTTVKTEGASLNMKMIKDIRIIDEQQIPDEYYKPRELDMVKIRKVAIAGVVIPGVEVFEKPSMASTKN